MAPSRRMRLNKKPKAVIIGNRPQKNADGTYSNERNFSPESAFLYNPLRQQMVLPDATPMITPRWVIEKRRVEEEQRKIHDSFHLFPLFPCEIREMIWEMAMPEGKVIYLHSQLDYFNDYIISYPSFGIPELSLACCESKRVVSKWGIGLRFCGFDEPLHCEWFDRRRDSIYIPSIHVFKGWHGWKKCMGGATVILNVLETIEDQYRGRLPSKAFKWAIQSGYFEGVHAIDLAMLTIKCTGVGWDKEHDAFGEGGLVGVVGLDDKRLITMLRPIFNALRRRYKDRMEFLQNVPHRRPSCLLKRLHTEWNRDLKFLFEEQWLFSQSRVSREEQYVSELFTDIEFGFQGRRRALNREHDTIRKLIDQMPEIRPVIVFDRTPTPVPDQALDGPHHWNNRRGYDGLEVISNRRGMVLAYDIYDGRSSQFG